ncbi:MAG: OFA family MFS transporter [Planctomycetes bacterium]|nr:OFA family MFS transporter [Planctomycetota bacterium]
MNQVTADSGELIKNHGWRVAFSGMGINLALGILYTWSVISKGIPADWGWSESDKSLPYAVACLVFALVMVPAGRMQDKIGPRIVATIGGILVGIGFLVASTTTTPFIYMIGFGVLAGAGIGFGYASATPPAVKWFPPEKTGLIAGIVVSGFGLASVYAAPLAKWLTVTYGLQIMMKVLGIGFLIVVVTLAQFLKAPHKVLQWIKEYGDIGRIKREAMQKEKALAEGKEVILEKKENYTPGEMLKTVQFYMLWFMYACGAGAGLMIISKLAAIASIQAGIKLGFILVAVLAVGNGGGRILAGMLSDKIGRKPTMFICFVLQAVLIILISQAKAVETATGELQYNILANMVVLAIISALIGANYGANLALFPSITKDYYGLKNFGTNYGLVFTSWGVGGFMLAKLAGDMYDKYQTFNIAYFSASALLILAALMSLFIKPPHHHIEVSED